MDKFSDKSTYASFGYLRTQCDFVAPNQWACATFKSICETVSKLGDGIDHFESTEHGNTTSLYNVLEVKMTIYIYIFL